MAQRQPSAPAIVPDPDGVLQMQPNNPRPASRPPDSRPSSRPPLPGAEHSALDMPNHPAPYMHGTDFDEQTVVKPMTFTISSMPPPPANAILDDLLDPQRKPGSSDG